MPSMFDLVTVDAADSELVAGFWAAALLLVEVQREDNGRWIVLADATGMRRIGVQRITDLGVASACWDGADKPRLHLDVACAPAEFDAEVERLLLLGAIQLRLPRHEDYGAIATMTDVEGNVFDLCAYH